MSSPDEYQIIDPISVQVVQYRTDWSDIGSVRVEADPQAVENDVAVLARKIALRAISAAANSMLKLVSGDIRHRGHFGGRNVHHSPTDLRCTVSVGVSTSNFCTPEHSKSARPSTNIF
ncbi:hypothetical protein [Ensifer canadensis]